MFEQQDIKRAIIHKVPHIAFIYYLLTLLIKHFIGVSDTLGTSNILLVSVCFTCNQWLCKISGSLLPINQFIIKPAAHVCACISASISVCMLFNFQHIHACI